VVINEVFYNASDGLDDLQWVALHNTAGRPADVSGWTLDDGRLYTFPANTGIAPNGYVVVALSPDRFMQFYEGPVLGRLKRALQRGGEKIELKDAAGNYLAYHDTKRSKWMMFPWDQDKTWGYYDGLPDDQVFFEMP